MFLVTTIPYLYQILFRETFVMMMGMEYHSPYTLEVYYSHDDYDCYLTTNYLRVNYSIFYYYIIHLDTLYKVMTILI